MGPLDDPYFWKLGHTLQKYSPSLIGLNETNKCIIYNYLLYTVLIITMYYVSNISSICVKHKHMCQINVQFKPYGFVVSSGQASLGKATLD